MINFLVYK